MMSHTTVEYLNSLISLKKALAQNLVAKGVAAVDDELLDTLVPKVLDILQESILAGTASEEQVLEGSTFYNTDSNQKLTGTMTNNGAVAEILLPNGSYVIPKGYHDGSGKVTQSIPTMAAASITPSTAAQSFATSGKYCTGNMTVNAIPVLGVTHIDYSRINNSRVEFACQSGYHGCSWANNQYEYMTYDEILNLIGATSAKICSGQTILNRAGTGVPSGYNKVTYGYYTSTLSSKSETITFSVSSSITNSSTKLYGLIQYPDGSSMSGDVILSFSNSGSTVTVSLQSSSTLTNSKFAVGTYKLLAVGIS